MGRGAFEGCGEEPQAPAVLDPMQRLLAPPPLPVPPAVSGNVVSASRLDQVAVEFVRRCSMRGDGRNGRVRLEFGAGELAGGVVHLEYDADTRRLDVELELPHDADLRSVTWSRDLEARLRDRGLPVGDFRVS